MGSQAEGILLTLGLSEQHSKIFYNVKAKISTRRKVDVNQPPSTESEVLEVSLRNAKGTKLFLK